MKSLINYINSLEPLLPPSEEEKYNIAYYSQDMKQIKIMLFLVMSVPVIWFFKEFKILDYRFSLFWVYLLRLGYIAAGIAFVLNERNKSKPIINKKLFLIFAVLIVLHQSATLASRPINYPFTSFTSMILIFFIYFTFPMSITIRSFLAISMSLFEILFILIMKDYQAGGVFTVVFAYMAINFLCITYSARINTTRRNNFRQISEKEILLRESHHRIKNNIASIEGILSLQAETSADTGIKTALKDSIARVQSMRVLYDKLLLGKDYKEVSIKDYTESLIESIAEVFNIKGKVTIEKQISDFNLNTNMLIPVGIIINELLTNIFKYAFTGRNSGLINVSLDKIDNHVVLTIQDNGNGIDDKGDLSKLPGFGLSIVRMLAEQLKGSYTIENYNGTRSILKFDI
jgi:two-component sensor histidine kinase